MGRRHFLQEKRTKYLSSSTIQFYPLFEHTRTGYCNLNNIRVILNRSTTYQLLLYPVATLASGQLNFISCQWI
uniref:Uncharacterized protein n=1 Tax=Pararge aegeria TaxID=116150 RepID=S4P6P3_9NEOP